MSDFEARLRKAIDRGERRSDEKRAAAARQALSEEELRRLHTQYRLELSERIEQCVRKLTDAFPGFQYETIYGERGWGAACRRDDFDSRGGSGRNNLYSRLEMTVRPHSPLQVLDLAGKGTIRNKEVFHRNFFKKLEEVDSDEFAALIDAWALEYAERFAATR